MSHKKSPHHPSIVQDEFNYYFKILFLGSIGVGKTSIINRYIKDIFINEQKSTIGIDYKTKTVIYNSKKIKLKIFDTSGQERFRTLTKNYYQNAHGIILVFDLKRVETFDELTYWMDEINKNCDKDKIGMILIGNKKDGDLNEIKIKNEQINQIAKLYNFSYIETSAVTNQNIKECFDLMVKILYEKNIISKTKNNNGEINQENMKNKKSNKNLVNIENNENKNIILNNNQNTNNNTANNNNEESCCNG